MFNWGAASGILVVSETEEKIEEPEGEENNKPTGSGKKPIVDSKKELSTLLSNWNPIIVTNGQTFNNQQKSEALQQQLPAGVDATQVEITINGTSVTIKPIRDSTAYKGNPVTVSFTLDKRIHLMEIIKNKNLQLKVNTRIEDFDNSVLTANKIKTVIANNNKDFKLDIFGSQIKIGSFSIVLNAPQKVIVSCWNENEYNSLIKGSVEIIITMYQ